MPITEPASSIKELSAELNCSEVTIWRAIKSGDLRAVKIGRLTRILPEDKRAFLASRQPVRAA
jgi:excisionase family DNA binding protein